MITFKRVEFKKQTKTLKHSGYTYEYKSYYVARYDNGKLMGISTHEHKYFDTCNGISGGLYINRINPLSNTFAKAKSLIEAQS